MAKRPTSPSSGRRPVRPQPPGVPPRPEQRELSGPLKFMAANPRLLGFLNIVAAILLLYFTVSGFLEGRVFLPFGFGLMGLYFFYSYVRNSLQVNFGKLTLPLNLLLLLSALVCLVIGLNVEK